MNHSINLSINLSKRLNQTNNFSNIFIKKVEKKKYKKVGTNNADIITSLFVKMMLTQYNRIKRQTITFFLSWFFSVVQWVITFLFNVNENGSVSSVYTVEEMFLDDQHERFLDTYDSGAQDARANENTDPEFYDSELYKKALTDPNNELEKKWKRNILYSNTPRGNIAMFYDAYKKGFAYYCDMQSVSANILNAIAMKYVMVFRCRDLFMDNKLTPEERDSPLIVLQIAEEKAEKEKKKENLSIINPDLLKKAPFAKLKKYSNPNASSNVKGSSDEKQKEKEKEEPHYTNKFIYLGKVLNFSFIQKTPRKKVSSVASSVVFQGSKFEGLFEQEHQLQKDVMSYKDFKREMERKSKGDAQA